MAKVVCKSPFIDAADKAWEASRLPPGDKDGTLQHTYAHLLRFVIGQAMEHAFVIDKESKRLDDSKRRLLAQGVGVVAAVWPDFAADVRKRLPTKSKRGAHATPAWLEQEITAHSDLITRQLDRQRPSANAKVRGKLAGESGARERADAAVGAPYGVGPDRVKRIRLSVKKRAR